MLTTILLASFAGAPEAPLLRQAPRGFYVEARTAAVYAGACHLGSQYTTQGRAAVLAWRFEDGAHEGVALAGLNLVVVRSAGANLAEVGAEVESVVYLDAREPAERRRAALAWLRATHGELLGGRSLVRTAELALEHDGEAYRLAARGEGTRIELAGRALPERECCTMPYGVGYDPFVELPGRVVGCSEVFALEEAELGQRFLRRAENNVFLGGFGDAAEVPPRAIGATGTTGATRR